MRTVGASRRQILWSVIVEALTIGIIASVIGLFVGFGLAVGLNELFKALELDLPTSNMVFATRTIVVSLLVGTIITLLAGLFPAIRATRVPPIAAVREGFTPPRSRLAPFVPYIAVAVIGLAVLLLGYAMFKDQLDTASRLLSIAGGVVLLFLGVALISSHTVRPLAVGTSPVARWALIAISIIVYPITLGIWALKYGLLARGAPWGRRILALALTLPVAEYLLYVVISVVLGWFSLGAGWGLLGLVGANVAIYGLWKGRRLRVEWPADVPGIPRDRSVSVLARENSRRNPGRTAATAAALMIGIALVSFVAVLANGMKASNRGAIEDQVHADYVITAQDGFTPFVAAAGDAVAGSPDAEVVSNVRADLGKVGDASTYVTGIDPRTILDTYTFDWKEGDDRVVRNLGPNQAIVDAKFAEDNDIAVGDTIPILTPSGATLDRQVVGLYEPPPFYPLLGGVSITTQTFDSYFDRPRNQFTFVNVPGDPTDAKTESLEAAVADFPDAKVQTRDAWIDQQDEDFNQFLIMLYVLLALSVIVEHLRDGQHARPLGLRADARAGDAAGGRHDPDARPSTWCATRASSRR